MHGPSPQIIYWDCGKAISVPLPAEGFPIYFKGSGMINEGKKDDPFERVVK
jgi:hypothetical protein